MRVIEPHQFQHLKPVKAKKSITKYFILIVIISSFIIGYHRFNRPLPDLQVKLSSNLKAGPKIAINWPENEQAALGILGKGLVSSNNTSLAVPIASTAKIITALMVLDKKPLKLNEDGPSIVITEQDKQIFDQYYQEDGSVVPVEVGEVLTERQALQAMLLPSANNIAVTLTNWAFGSQEAYLDYANKFLANNKLTKTVVSDSSGYSPKTVSSADEMVKIAVLDLKNPVFSEIVSETQADIPVVGIVKNTNWLLGKNGINGVKTGHTDQAKGCFIVSANITLENQKNINVVGVILGSKDIDQAMIDIQPLVLEQLKSGYKNIQVITKDQKFGELQSSWGEKSLIVANQDLKLYGWQEDKPQINVKLNDLKKYKKDQIIGSADVTLGDSKSSVKLVQYNEIKSPNFWWKFKRIFSS